jgi:hypothetical protein
MADRMTIGAIVRHLPTGALGTIIDHFMWDAGHGGFEIKFTKPIKLSSLGRTVERTQGHHRDFELVSGV